MADSIGARTATVCSIIRPCGSQLHGQLLLVDDHIPCLRRRRAQLPGCRLVDGERHRIDDDAVDLPGGLDRDHLVLHVECDQFWRPLERIADTAAAATDLDNDVAGLDLHHAVRLDADWLPVAQDEGARRRRRAAALRARLPA